MATHTDTSSGSVSPELVLVDPELAALVRAALPEAPMPPARAPETPPEPSTDRRRRRGRVVGALFVLVVLGAAVLPLGQKALNWLRAPELQGAARDSRTHAAAAQSFAAAAPAANTGYVFAAGGRFQIGPTGDAIVGLTLPRICNDVLELSPLRLLPGSEFRFRGMVPGTTHRVTVILYGRFDDASHATLRVSATGLGCTARPLVYRASLS